MLKKILLSLGVVVILLAAATVFVVWRYPMAVFNWQNRRALKSAGFQREVVSSPVGDQVVWEKGAGTPLVFLHGAGDHAGSWSKVAPEFTSSYRVLVLDLAGHGESAPASGPLDIGRIITALDAVIAARSQGKQAILAGNSLGGWVATLYAQQHPDLVSRLILNSGGPLRGEREDLAKIPQNREDAAKIFDAVLDEGTPKPAGFVLDDVVRQAQNGPMSRLAKSDMNPYLVQGKLENFNVPVDLVWGESDRLVPITYAERLRGIFPAVRLMKIPRCGHVPQQECPVTYTRVLRQVLELPPPTPQPAPSAGIEKGAQ